MNTENMIDITKANLTELVKAAYDLSAPQGMGIMHYKEGPLSDEDAAAIIERGKGDRLAAVSMDYVHGRACKLAVLRDKDTGGLFIRDRWYDHSDRDLAELLDRVGVVP